MVNLSKLDVKDFGVFKSWIADERQLFQFAGTLLHYPLTDKQLQTYILDKQREVYKVQLTDTDEIIGNAELNFENPLPRLSRILIGEEKHRNKGLGRHIINKMLEILFLTYNFTEADLNVFDWNIAAIKCYQNAGFIVNPDVVYKHSIDGEAWTAINMRIGKAQWLKKNK